MSYRYSACAREKLDLRRDHLFDLIDSCLSAAGQQWQVITRLRAVSRDGCGGRFVFLHVLHTGVLLLQSRVLLLAAFLLAFVCIISFGKAKGPRT